MSPGNPLVTDDGPSGPGPKTRLLQEAWAELKAAAIAFGKGDPRDGLNISRLAAAAVDYARFRALNTAAAPQRPLLSDRPIPFGRDAGTKLRDATSPSLRWVHAAVSKRLDKAPKYRADNEALLEAIAHELQFRGEPLEKE